MNVTIIADASHCPETGAAGYGYWIACQRGKRGGGGAMRGVVRTSTEAEMQALVNALYLALQFGLVQTGDMVLLQTDCHGAISGFGGKRTLSETETVVVEAFRGLLSGRSLEVEFRHVKGHSRQPGARYVTNNLCDQRAKQAMRRARAALRRAND